MDKLITSFTGKMPLVLEDLDWLDQGMRRVINLLGAGFQEGNVVGGYIVTGCTFTESDGSTTITAGLVFKSGELFWYPGGTTSAAPSVIQFVEDFDFDAAGAKVFGNGVSRNVYEIRRAKIVTSGSSGIPLTGALSFRLADRIYSLIESKLPAAINATLEAPVTWIQPTFFSGFSHNISTPVKYRKRIGQVEIKGIALGGSGVVFNLPSGYRPASAYSAICDVFYDSTTVIVRKLNINTDGNVSIESTESGPDYISRNMPINVIIPLT